jgi:hypothetical protein
MRRGQHGQYLQSVCRPADAWPEGHAIRAVRGGQRGGLCFPWQAFPRRLLAAVGCTLALTGCAGPPAPAPAPAQPARHLVLITIGTLRIELARRERSPLCTLRADGCKYIAAPRSELYDLSRDPGELSDLSASAPRRSAALRDRVDRYSPASLDAPGIDPEARARLQALGYASAGRRDPTGNRPDQKDRRALAAALAEVASGELNATRLETTLRAILREDPGNAQANVRLGYALLESNRARPRFRISDRRSCRASPAPTPTSASHSARCGRSASRRRSAR